MPTMTMETRPLLLSRLLTFFLFLPPPSPIPSFFGCLAHPPPHLHTCCVVCVRERAGRTLAAAAREKKPPYRRGHSPKSGEKVFFTGEKKALPTSGGSTVAVSSAGEKSPEK